VNWNGANDRWNLEECLRRWEAGGASNIIWMDIRKVSAYPACRVNMRKVSAYLADRDDMQKVSAYPSLSGGYAESFRLIIVIQFPLNLLEWMKIAGLNIIGLVK
jgi:hypothetical protein